MTRPETLELDPRAMASSLRDVPGVYQMLDTAGKVLYIGKARSLKRRVMSYFRNRGQNNRVMAMVARIRQVQVTVTGSETEALLLEQNLIKQQHPPYNILLRDDKSFPSIRLSDEEFPRLSFHRGARRPGARYFGPYPSSSAVRDSLHFLHRAFRLRQCENSMFRNRTRPCLQYQIKRCSAPCVGHISAAAYARSVADATLFLEGRSRDLLEDLAQRMEGAAGELDYESAALLRDQIQALNHLQENQYIDGEHGDVDIVAAACAPELVCVQLLYVRGGRVLGSRSFFPRLPLGNSPAEVLSAFLPRFYLGGAAETPSRLILSHQPGDAAVLAEALSQASGRRIELQSRVRGPRSRWLRICRDTARQNLAARLAGEQRIGKQFTRLQQALELPVLPERIECFDISHSGGTETLASCVVFSRNGPLKSDYRRYRIEDVTPGDDFAALRQTLLRRFTGQSGGDGKLPDVLLVDGGHGQLKQASDVWQELGLPEVLLVGIAKGPERRPELDYLCLEGGEELRLAADDAALHLIQQLRDEAHRFAITGHRQRRAKRSGASPLERIPGIGATRRRNLLRFFGGLQGVERASVEDLQRVPGISTQLAKTVRAALANDDAVS